jgi:VanZ family protein
MPRGRLSRWAPVLAWALVIFAFSSIPSLGTGLGPWDLVLRKFAHLVEFAILGALLARAVDRVSFAIALGSAYAATDELHQVFVPGRAGTIYDWALDTVGVAVGVLLYVRVRRGREAKIRAG